MKRARPCRHIRVIKTKRGRKKILINRNVLRKIRRRNFGATVFIRGDKDFKQKIRVALEEPEMKKIVEDIQKPKMSHPNRDIVIKQFNHPTNSLKHLSKLEPWFANDLKKSLEKEKTVMGRSIHDPNYNKHIIEIRPFTEKLSFEEPVLLHELDHALKYRISTKEKLNNLFSKEKDYLDRPGEKLAFEKEAKYLRSKPTRQNKIIEAFRKEGYDVNAFDYRINKKGKLF
jgi:hypothetical protein